MAGMKARLWYNYTIMKELDKRFDQTKEAEIYELWQKSGGFAPEARKTGKPYCIIMPPPNANGPLHIGHAMFVTLEDALIRYHRLRGERALWLPGFDHAGFESQVVYEKKLTKEGRSRFQLSREELYKEIWDFTQSNIGRVKEQFGALGASADWSRLKFTLDPDIVSIVYGTFKQLHDDGLVYRDARPVNWCTKHQTALSDLEVTFVERQDPLYYLKYGPFELATVRPETKFGDTAVAVNPADERYLKYVGQEIEIETLLGPAKIKVIADEHVDPKFGTGVVKITPAHDPNDFEVGKRHNLEVKEVIDQFGKLNEKTGPYAGLKIAEAREKIVEDMKAEGLITKVNENYTHTVGTCYKCGTVIEPRILPQWFVATTKTSKSGKNLRDDAVKAIKTGQTKFITKRFENIYMSWMSELRDWNISRQIAWGIQLPVWYCANSACEPVITAGETPESCLSCGGTELTRDPDVFDTWFSSGQWPFATLKTTGEKDFDEFYPTAVMETAYDIIFFWVARMMMLGLYATGKVPFETIYIHGLVRDKDKQKMSKSKGNVVDPLGMVSEYGADATRFALVYGNAAGTDPVISEEKIRGMRNFTTKLWNIARFIGMQTEGVEKYEWKTATEADKAIAEAFNESLETITTTMESYQLHLAAEKLYNFIWHDLADIYIEATKELVTDEANGEQTKQNLLAMLQMTITMLHPFMPFVTEAIYQQLPSENKGVLMLESWPEQIADL